MADVPGSAGRAMAAGGGLSRPAPTVFEACSRAGSVSNGPGSSVTGARRTARNVCVHDHLRWLVWLVERWCVGGVLLPGPAPCRDRDPSGVGADRSEDVV